MTLMTDIRPVQGRQLNKTNPILTDKNKLADKGRILHSRWQTGQRESPRHLLDLTYQNVKKDHYTWVRKRILSATCTLVHRRRSTRRPFMTLVKGGAQCDVRPWQCLPLPFGNYCAHTTSQPNVVVSHYGQVYRSQKICISGPM